MMYRKYLILLLFLSCLLSYGYEGYSQCAPRAACNADDPEIPALCFEPSVARVGSVNVSYSNVSQLVFSRTVLARLFPVFPPQEFYLSRIEVVGVENLPAGLNIEIKSNNPEDGAQGLIGDMGNLTPLDSQTPIFACFSVTGTPRRATTTPDSVYFVLNYFLKQLDPNTDEPMGPELPPLPGTQGIKVAYKVPIDEAVAGLTVNAGPDLEVLCGQPAQLKARASKPGVTYSWRPTTGLDDPSSPTPIATPAVTTTYTVTVSDGIETAQDEVTVFIRPESFNANIILQDSVFNAEPFDIRAVNLTFSPQAEFVWIFGDGNERTTTFAERIVTHTYQTCQNYTLTIVIRRPGAPCGDTLRKNIQCTLATLTVDAGQDQTTTCGSPLPIRLNAVANMPNTTFQWEPTTGLNNPNIPNPIVTNLARTTTYTVTARNGNQVARDEVTIFVNRANFRVNFTANPTNIPNPPYTTQFINTTPPLQMEFFWDFGDGNTSTQTNPSHTYQNPGTYTVRLIARRQGTQCEDTLIRANYIVCGSGSTGPLTVNAGPDIRIPCGAPRGAQLNATANKAGTVFSWQPTTGLNNPNIANPVANIYTTTTYVVTARNGNEIARDTVTVIVEKANFRVNFVGTPTELTQAPYTVQFTNLTPPNPGVQFEYLWDFGDGNTSTQNNPSHTYQAPGRYTVRLIVRQAGTPCADTLTRAEYIRVIQSRLTVNAGPDRVTQCGTPVALQATANKPNSTFSWVPTTGLNDPNIPNPTATLSATTTYIVTATNGNEVARDTIVIRVTPARYMLNFTANPTTLNARPFNVTFQNSTSTPGLNYLWDYGDGNRTQNNNPTHTYTYQNNGVYTVMLIGNRPNTQCFDTLVRNSYIRINDGTGMPLQVYAGNDLSTSCGSPIQLRATANKSGATFRWEPGTFLNNPNIATPIATPDRTITYVVIAQLGNEIARDTITVTVTPANFPVSFDATPTFMNAPPFNVQFTNTTPNAANYQFEWDFGDGQTSTQQSPRHTYASPGRYTVTLKATLKNTNCSVTFSRPNYIVCEDGQQRLRVSAGPDATINCGESYTISTNITPLTPEVRISWSPATGLNDATIQNPVASPRVTTAYTVTVQKGTEVARDTIVINVKPIPAPTISENAGVLTASTINVRYQWYREGVIINGATARSYTPTTAGNYTVEITDSKDCRAISAPYNFTPTGWDNATFSGFIKIYPNPTQGVLWVESENSGVYAIECVNLLGRVMQADKIEVSLKTPYSYSVEQLPNGFYWLCLTDSSGKRFSVKFFKE
jgi:PKD repeat protein